MQEGHNYSNKIILPQDKYKPDLKYAFICICLRVSEHTWLSLSAMVSARASSPSRFNVVLVEAGVMSSSRSMGSKSAL